LRHGGASTTLNYCNVQDGWGGAGASNIDTDPMFVDADGPDDDPLTLEDNDYRLGGGSLCIDAGDNAAVPAGVTTDLDGNPRFVDDPDTTDTGIGFGPIVDMGAYEFQPCPEDVNGDGVVNVLDLIELLLCFGQPAIPGCEAEDITGDGTVNVLDLIELLLEFGTVCP
jgi:hypothetical protein